MVEITETLVSPVATSTLPIENFGDFKMIVFETILDSPPVALIKKPLHPNQIPLVRIHSECFTGDVFGSCKCDCGQQLKQALKLIGEQGGILIYLRQEGRGIGLVNKMKAYALQEEGFDTVEANIRLGLPADNRNYEVAFRILKHLGVESVRLLTNNPNKVAALDNYGILVSERVALSMEPTVHNRMYLKTKQEKMGHFLEIE